MTNIRQQSEKLLAAGGTIIAASPLTLFRMRENVRLKALQSSEMQITSCNALQFCYDGGIVIKSDRYVFLAQFIDDLSSEEVVIKSFPFGTSVISENLVQHHSRICESILPKICVVMADTMASTFEKIWNEQRFT